MSDSLYLDEDSEELKRIALPTVVVPEQIPRRKTDVAYGPLDCQKLDVYYPPEGDGPFPVVFYIHGGSWLVGDRRHCALDCIVDALDVGYALVVPDYRLLSEAPFPEFIFDVKTAVRWARAHAAEYGFDAARFAMVGDSAGGHIVQMIAFTANHPEYEGGQYGWEAQSSAVQAVCSLYGISDISADDAALYRASGVPRVRTRTEPLNYKKLFGVEAAPLLRLLSPISLAGADSAPILLMHGIRDGVVPYQHSELLWRRMEAVCPGKAELRLYPERNHCDAAFMTRESCMEIIDFFNKTLQI